MLYTKRKRLVITKSAWREMDHLGMSVQRLAAAIDDERKNSRAEGPGSGWRRTGSLESTS
ncbi:MAG: hypothetical protein AB1476_02925 [Candidatus Hadarchaeota archaeon]